MKSLEMNQMTTIEGGQNIEDVEYCDVSGILISIATLSLSVIFIVNPVSWLTGAAAMGNIISCTILSEG